MEQSFQSLQRWFEVCDSMTMSFKLWLKSQNTLAISASSVHLSIFAHDSKIWNIHYVGEIKELVDLSLEECFSLGQQTEKKILQEMHKQLSNLDYFNVPFTNVLNIKNLLIVRKCCNTSPNKQIYFISTLSQMLGFKPGPHIYKANMYNKLHPHAKVSYS